MTVSFSLRDQVALVTGASKGIGQAIAVALAEAGARVACSARAEESLTETLGLISDVGGLGVPVAWDVRDPEAAGPAVSSVEERLGPLRLAVNNAGIGAGTPALELTPDQWRSVYATNVDGVFWSCQAQARAMQAHGEGGGGWGHGATQRRHIRVEGQRRRDGVQQLLPAGNRHGVP